MKLTTFFLALLPISGLAILDNNNDEKDDNIRRRLSKSSRTGKEDDDYDDEEEEDTEESINTFEIRLESTEEEEQRGGKQGNNNNNNNINFLGYTTSSSTLCSSDNLSSDPTLKSAELEFFGQNLNGYQFVSYPDSYQFDRKPALQAFVFNNAMNYDIEPNMIGVRAEEHGVKFLVPSGWD